MNLFLTGTDTGVGKTYVSCALVREQRERGVDCVGLKPISCGDRLDAMALGKASEGVLSLEEVNPVWLAAPAAPYLAAMLESRTLDLPLLRASVGHSIEAHEQVIVEGIGGWLVPITRDYFVSDFAADLGLPVVVVAANRLGMLNQTLLTVQAIQARGLVCAGVIMNEVHQAPEGSIIPTGNRMVLDTILEVPILGELAFGERKIRWASGSLSASATHLD